MGRFVSEHFTSLTLDIKTEVVSDEDTTEIWESVKEEVIEKVRRNKDRTSGGDSTVIDVGEVEKSFCLSRPDDWVVNRKMKKIILLEFKRWDVEVVPLVAGHRSVKEKEWLESFRVFGIGKEDDKKIIRKLGLTLFSEYEELFGIYWRHTFGPQNSLLQLLGKGISVRVFQPPTSE